MAKKQKEIAAEKKQKSEKKSSARNIVICIILLAVLTGLGIVTGVFDSISNVTKMLAFVDLETIIQLVIMVVFVTLLSNLVQLILHLGSTKIARLRTLKSIFESLITYATILIIACWGLSIIGVNVSTIFASIGVVALVLGFGAESLVADVVTGLFVVFENQFNVGDIVELDGFRGEVTYIGIRSLGITDGGGNIKIVNHSSVNNLINRSDCKSVAVCDFGVAYETDLEALEEKMPKMLENIKAKHPDIFIGDMKYAGVETLGDSSVVLRVTAVVDEKNVYSGRRLLNKEMKIQLDAQGVDIPFPQVTVRKSE